MTHYYTNSLKGIILLTNNLPAVLAGHKTNDLYKFIWIQEGKATLVVDHVEKTLGKDEFISLSPLHDIKIKKQKGNISDFYSIQNSTASTSTMKKSHATDYYSMELLVLSTCNFRRLPSDSFMKSLIK